jgi:hypothetical protein
VIDQLAWKPYFFAATIRKTTDIENAVVTKQTAAECGGWA